MAITRVANLLLCMYAKETVGFGMLKAKVMLVGREQGGCVPTVGCERLWGRMRWEWWRKLTNLGVLCPPRRGSSVPGASLGTASPLVKALK